MTIFTIMERSKFEKLVGKALANLPKLFKDRLDNVDVVIRDAPSSAEDVSIEGASGRMVLGLYQGVPLVKRNRYYGMVMPDKISIYQKSIERVCGTEEEIVRLVRHTVQHELAHHFGVTDKRMKELDIY